MKLRYWNSLPLLTTKQFPSRPNNGTRINCLPATDSTELIKLISTLPNKTSPLDPIPISLLKHHSLTLAPILVKIVNKSFQDGSFPTIYKTAQILPLLKKPTLNSDEPSNYRPISNLSTFSKLIERLVIFRIRNQLILNPNFSTFQSAYRSSHSTETALLHITDDIYNECSNHNAVIMTSLDLSAAFDTIDHNILLNRLQTEFGFEGSALDWVASYLQGRMQYVKLDRHSSSHIEVNTGVPQGSVLGPILFTTYISPIDNIAKQYDTFFHRYADDTHLHISLSPSNPISNTDNFINCINSIHSWFTLNFLQLNPDKCENLLICTKQQYHKFNHISSINVAGSILPIKNSLKLLGVTFDRHLTFDIHVSNIIKSCNYHIRAISHIRHFLTTDITSTLARCLILSKIDYCNSLLYLASCSSRSRLQSIQNKTARLVFGLNTSPKSVYNWANCPHSSTLLKDLHWLPLNSRITYKIALLTFKILNSHSPIYLNNLISCHNHNKNLRASSSCFLNIPLAKSKFASRGFLHAAPHVWNSLSPELRNCSSLHKFKRLLKTFLFMDEGSWRLWGSCVWRSAFGAI